MVAIVIILLIAAAVCALYFAKEEYSKYKLESLKTNMVSLQVKVKVLGEEVNIKKEGASYIGKKLSENLEDEAIKALIEKGIVSNEDENFEEYYILEAEDLKKLKVLNSSLNRAVVNYKTYEIININGFKIKDSIFYKLSDFNKIDNKDTNQEENIENNQVNEVENNNQE